MKQSPRRNKKQAYSYSKGELNRAIDSLIHPLSKRNPTLIILDVILHSLVEQKPAETIAKFMRYTGPEIVNELTKNRGKKHAQH